MKIYTKMTLNDLIQGLRALPQEAMIQGFDPDIDSYRGYYERNAVAPADYKNQAHVVARSLSEQIGKYIMGYKGGDYYVSGAEGIYLAAYGDTGPCFVGLEEVEPGVYEPVLVEEGLVW